MTVRLLDGGEVRGVDELQAGARDARRDALAVLGRRRGVLAAGDDERRRADGAQLGDEVHVLDGRAAAGVALVGRRGQHGAHRRGCRGGLALDEARRSASARCRRRRSPRRPRRGRSPRDRPTSPAAPGCADVQHSTSRSMRSGALMASHIPTIPPSDSPHQCTRSSPRRSRRARASAPRSASAYGPGGTGEPPWPRWS